MDDEPVPADKYRIIVDGYNNVLRQRDDGITALEAETGRLRTRAGWLRRALAAANKDRRFAWNEFARENRRAVDIKLERDALQVELELTRGLKEAAETALGVAYDTVRTRDRHVARLFVKELRLRAVADAARRHAAERRAVDDTPTFVALDAAVGKLDGNGAP